ncbi:hypothetical protein [Joostella sp.]|uniref:hypothetical protein n=1 Tax=Joostella sp. TaxID=2231138 RepID=UPI003A92B40D
MLKRYPHSAQIKYTTSIDDGSGIPTTEPVTIDIEEGRYDPTGQNTNLDYSAKFYCPTLSVNRFQYDGAKLVFAGKTFSIVNLFNYQTHCEIWLE